jgi:hypothetical protein
MPQAGWSAVSASWTVPGAVLTPVEWRRIFNTFCQQVIRAGFAMIWRVELQRRKQPHVHAVVFVPNDDGLACGRFAIVGVSGWWDILEKAGRFTKGAREHSVTWEKMPIDNLKWWKYLTGHSSKKKAAQLGWKGRQWGVIGRARIVFEKGELIFLTRLQECVLKRAVRRYCRMRRGLRNNWGRTDVMMSPGLRDRLVAWSRTVTPADKETKVQFRGGVDTRAAAVSSVLGQRGDSGKGTKVHKQEDRENGNTIRGALGESEGSRPVA